MTDKRQRAEEILAQNCFGYLPGIKNQIDAMLAFESEGVAAARKAERARLLKAMREFKPHSQHCIHSGAAHQGWRYIADVLTTEAIEKLGD